MVFMHSNSVSPSGRSRCRWQLHACNKQIAISPYFLFAFLFFCLRFTFLYGCGWLFGYSNFHSQYIFYEITLLQFKKLMCCSSNAAMGQKADFVGFYGESTHQNCVLESEICQRHSSVLYFLVEDLSLGIR